MTRMGLLLLAALFAACGGARPAAKEEVPKLHGNIAVLPFDSMATSLLGPQLLREHVHNRLKGLGYEPAPLEAVDEALRRIGITDGGQLRSVAAAKVGEALGVSRYVAGNVTEFSDQNLGFIRRRIVALELSLVDAASSVTVWKDDGRAENSQGVLDAGRAKRSFLEGVIVNAAEKALGKPLDSESRAAVDRVMRSFPRR